MSWHYFFVTRILPLCLPCAHLIGSSTYIIRWETVFFSETPVSCNVPLFFSSLTMKSQNMTMEMKAIEKHFPVVLFAILCDVFYKFWLRGTNPNLWPFNLSLPVVLFLYAVIAFGAMDETLNWNHSDEICWSIRSCSVCSIVFWLLSDALKTNMYTAGRLIC